MSALGPHSKCTQLQVSNHIALPPVAEAARWCGRSSTVLCMEAHNAPRAATQDKDGEPAGRGLTAEGVLCPAAAGRGRERRMTTTERTRSAVAENDASTRQASHRRRISEVSCLACHHRQRREEEKGRGRAAPQLTRREGADRRGPPLLLQTLSPELCIISHLSAAVGWPAPSTLPWWILPTRFAPPRPTWGGMVVPRPVWGGMAAP